MSFLSASALSVFGQDGSQRAHHVRTKIRHGEWVSHTCGLASDHVHGNVVVLPDAQAEDFLRYCQRNRKCCPLLAVSEPGESCMPSLGDDIDIRTDLPRYRLWRHGEVVDEPTDVVSLWRGDLVTFVLGYPFSFEQAMLRAGLPMRHLECGRNVAMYKTSLATEPAGAFGGPVVVRMHPVKSVDALRAIDVTSHYPSVHGAPIHIGAPGSIGIDCLDSPDYGESVAVMDDELPVFWACGVTSQAALPQARPAFCITHAPGAMLITDLFNQPFAAS